MTFAESRCVTERLLATCGMTEPRFRASLCLGILALASLVGVAAASTLPPGFQETVVFSGHYRPVSVRFGPNGNIFVGEQERSASGSMTISTIRHRPWSSTCELRFTATGIGACWVWRSILPILSTPTFTSCTPLTRSRTARTRDGGTGGVNPQHR